jgi:phosphopantetheinyl transferase
MIYNQIGSEIYSGYFEFFNNESGSLVIWNSIDFNKGNRKVHEKKQIHKIIKSLGYDIGNLSYKDSGQPIILNHFLSITHSGGWFAIYISHLPIGIDIEVENKKIVNIKDYFMNSYELKKFDLVEDLHLIWGAKEAFYKLKEGQIVEIKNDITVKELTNQHIVVQYKNTLTQLRYKKIKDIYVVWS